MHTQPTNTKGIGAALLIASYYTRKEASLRFALFFMFGAFGPCIGGVRLSRLYAIKSMLKTPSFSLSRFEIWMASRAKKAGDGES